jgi:hypothetical protein
MDNKRPPLSKLQAPVPASIWFKTHDTLPTESREESAKPKQRQKQPNKAESVPASIWFTHEEKLPNDRDVVVNVLVPDVPSTQRELESSKASALTKQNESTEKVVSSETPKVEFTHEQNSEIEELISSILNLTKSIQEDRLKELKKNEIEKDDPKAPKSFKELVTKITKEKYQETKEKLSVRNILQTVGVRSAYQGSGSVLDSLLSYREEKAKKKEPSVLGSAVLGSADFIKDKIKRATSPTFEKIKDITKSKIESSSIINQILKSSSSVKDSISSVSKNETIRNILSPIKALSTYSQEKAIKEPNSLIGSISRRYHPSIKNDKELDLARTLTSPHTKNEKKFTQEVRSGMRDELLELNEEQLDQLKKMVKALTETQEDRLEKKVKGPAPISTEKKPEQEKEKGLIGSLLEKAAGIKGVLGKGAGALGKAGGALAKAVGPALSAAAPALGVAAAGAAGYGVGTLINDKIINPATEKLTGVKGQTLGGAVYDAVDNVKGWFGNSDADKIAAAGSANKSRLAVGKVKDMTTATPQRAEQIHQIKTGMSAVDSAKSTAKKEAANIDARTTVNNNMKNVQYSRPFVKNPDNTFNKLLSGNFSH